MPLEELADDHLVQRCGACRAAHAVDLATLAASTSPAPDALVDERVVALPPCSACAAQEFLVRSDAADLDRAELGSYGHLHRLLVDDLHARLITSRAAARGAKGKTSMPTRDERAEALKRWFPNGLKLPLPDTTERAYIAEREG